jgi:hypothetical protein
MTLRVWPMGNGSWAVQERGYGAMGWSMWAVVSVHGNEWDARAACDAMARAEYRVHARVGAIRY